MALNSPPASVADRTVRILYYAFCGLVLLFLLLPILAIIPLSLNAASLLTYPLAGVSLRWYRDLFGSPDWMGAIRNSLLVALGATIIATPLGTLAALGLRRLPARLRPFVLSILVLPMIVPVIVFAIGAYFLYAPLGLTDSLLGMILAHAALGAPFVVLVTHAGLQGFDWGLMRAAASLGASPRAAFFKVLLPMIAPSIAAGAIFAFMTSFDEIVVAIFLAGPEQRTLPLQMFDGVREEISPTITAAATVLIFSSVSLLLIAEFLRRPRGERRSSGSPAEPQPQTSP